MFYNRFMIYRYFLFCLIFIKILSPPLLYSEDFTKLSSNDSVSIPRDLYYRDNFASQWWYFTGHLENDSGKSFGYETTFFIVNVNNEKFKSPFGLNRVYMLHSAITDINKHKYYYKNTLSRGAYNVAGFSADKKIVWVFDSYLKGNIDNFEIYSKNDNFSINLELTAMKNPVKNGDNGYSRKVDSCEECASLYFSITRLKTTGEINLNGKTYNVKGISWFDREINSDYDATKIKGWDWFSVQLNDGRDIMLYLLRDQGGDIENVSMGTIVYPDSSYRTIKLKDFDIKVLSHYRSKKTGKKYPSKWYIRIPSENLDLKVIPLVKDQEFIPSEMNIPIYWEGACVVEGSVNGKAYVELTGY
ncbi:MAG: lipocalin-like domain-containing protein [Deferribacterota bacterium]|nr:lipocalin-like domain-containing protein [Deferribacterota bacterium]